MECLCTYRGIHSVTLLLFWMRDKKTVGKIGVKIWTAILADIFHPGPNQVILVQ